MRRLNHLNSEEKAHLQQLEYYEEVVTGRVRVAEWANGRVPEEVGEEHEHVGEEEAVDHDGSEFFPFLGD